MTQLVCRRNVLGSAGVALLLAASGVESAALPVQAPVVESDGAPAIVAGHPKHAEWRAKVWGGGRSAFSVPTIATLVERLPGAAVEASTPTFYLVCDLRASELRKRELAELNSELEALALRYPEQVDLSVKVEAHEWTLLYLDRLTRLEESFLQFLGIGADEDIRYGVPGIEVFVLSEPRSYGLSAMLHDGATGIMRGPERVTIDGNDQRNIDKYFRDDVLPADKWVQAVTVHRTAAALLTRYMWADGRYQSSAFVPKFLEMGVAHYFELRLPAEKGVFFCESSELMRSADDWQADDWKGRMYRLGRAAQAPTVAELVRLDPSGGNTSFEHHVAAWSLVNYLHGLYGPESFRRFLDLQREGASVTDSIESVFEVTEAQLTKRWHEWVLKSRGRLVQPTASQQQGVRDSRAVLKDFKDVWEDRENLPLNVRLSAIETLRHVEPGAAVRELFEVMSEGGVEALSAVETLRRVQDPVAAAMIAQEMSSAARLRRQERYWELLIRCAGAFGDSAEELIPELIDLRSHKNATDRIRAGIARTLGELGDPSAVATLLADTEDFSHLVRAEALRSLALLHPESGREVAESLLDDDSWHVRIASIDVFRGAARWDSLPVLIERLDKENGRLREDILDVLVWISGPASRAPHKSDDPAAWRQWWAVLGSKQTGPTEVAASPPELRTLSASPRSFGKIYSKKFMFLVDISKSMSQTIQVTGGARRRIPKAEYVREELIRIIQHELVENVAFNLIMFARLTSRWDKVNQILHATDESKRSAIKWLTYQQLGEAHETDIHLCLEEIFDLADAGLHNQNHESTVDTVYFITDGTPTKGITDMEALLMWVRERNRMHGIRFNVVTIEMTDSNLVFLRRLAEENHGRCTVIRGER